MLIKQAPPLTIVNGWQSGKSQSGKSTYRIVRRYFSDEWAPETVRAGLTLAEAREWTNNPETSSQTATGAKGVARTAERGPWFDGYEEE